MATPTRPRPDRQRARPCRWLRGSEELSFAAALHAAGRLCCNHAALNAFTYQPHPARVIFGAGALSQLPAEIERLGARRALVLCTPGQVQAAERVASLLGDRAAGIFAQAVMHGPVETARQAREEARRLGADCAVAVGGGSTTGLGKASPWTAACRSWPFRRPTPAAR